MPQSDSNDKDLQPVDDIDRYIHSPTRMKILIVMAAVEKADFSFLVRMTQLTRGNLSANLRKLEEAGYLSSEKAFINRVPRTIISLTDEGRNALHTYRENMRTVLDELLKNLD